MTVTDLTGTDTAESSAQPEVAGDEARTDARCVVRARFWRLALGALGLFWVAAMLMLAR